MPPPTLGAPPEEPAEAPVQEQDPWRETWGTLLLYLIAAAGYILLGMYFHWLLSWTRGFLFAFVVVWVIPALYRRFRR